MALRLVTSISPRAVRGDPDCSKTKLTVRLQPREYFPKSLLPQDPITHRDGKYSRECSRDAKENLLKTSVSEKHASRPQDFKRPFFCWFYLRSRSTDESERGTTCRLTSERPHCPLFPIIIAFNISSPVVSSLFQKNFAHTFHPNLDEFLILPPPRQAR